MAHLIGIDVGTTTLKAVLLDAERGEIVDCVSLPNRVHHPRPDWSEYNPDELWDGVASCVSRLSKSNRPLDVRAVSVASMGEAGVPIDANGVCLYPIIAWYDPRTEGYARFWAEKLSAWRLFQITGLAIRHIFSLNKILWLRANHPETFRNMRKWLCMEDFIIWKMSGEQATDYTMASRTMAFDQSTRSWSAEMLELAQLDGEVLPKVYPSGKVVGELTARAASQMGIAPGTPVVTGGHDHLCAALAAGLLKEGQLLDSSGTAQAILALTPKFQPSRDLFQRALTHYPHVVEGQYIVQGGIPAAGGAIEWFVRLLANQEGAVGGGTYAALLAEAASVPPGSGGVCCVPHLLGSGTPQNDQESRGALLGLSMDHTRGHILRSVIEALGYSLRENVEAVEAALAQRIVEVIAVGGANRAALVRQIKADTTGRPITAPELEEATATGAALLAGVGVGIYSNTRQAARSLRINSQIYVPSPDAQATYDRRYHGVYLKLHRALADVNRELTS